MTVSNLWWEIIALCKFAASRRLLLEKWAIFDPFWPLGCPKKDQNLRFVLNEWQYQICDQKLNFQVLGVIFRGMDSFWPFYHPLTPRVLQNGLEHVVWQKSKCHNSCKINYVCKFLASSYHFIGNGAWWPSPPLWLPFDSRGLENDVRMGNCPGYKAILKYNPSVYQKPLRN